MGKHGPHSVHPSGRGYTTSKGYHRFCIWDSATKSSRLVLAHVYEWEKANGKIPDGFTIHHVNGDKQDNRLDNLRLVGYLEHKRLHEGCELRDGQWWKPCHNCGQLKPITTEHWYFDKRGYPLYGRCKPCHIKRVVADKRARKARRRVQQEAST